MIPPALRWTFPADLEDDSWAAVHVVAELVRTSVKPRALWIMEPCYGPPNSFWAGGNTFMPGRVQWVGRAEVHVGEYVITEYHLHTPCLVAVSSGVFLRASGGSVSAACLSVREGPS